MAFELDEWGYANRRRIRLVLRRACVPDKAESPQMALYSLKHRDTTVLRAATVPWEQIDCQLGRVQRGARAAQDYGRDGLGYLTEAATAVDA